MEEKLISIIIPIYKVEKYLDACLKSISCQTYTNLEIILVDDGSPDRCSEICDEWAQNDTRFKVIHQKNKGVAGARNTGLNAITGDFFIFIDPDDSISRKMIEIMVKALCESNADVVFCNFNIVGEATRETLKTEYLTKESKYITRNEAVDLILSQYDSMLWNKMYRRNSEIVQTPFNEELSIGEDLEWLLKVFLHVQQVYLVKEVLYNYVQRESSLTHSTELKTRLTEFSANENMIKLTQKYNDDNLFISAQMRKYAMGFGILRLAYDNKEYEIFEYLDKNLSEARKIWREHRNRPLLVLRYRVLEQLMRIKAPMNLIYWIENFMR